MISFESYDFRKQLRFPKKLTILIKFLIAFRNLKFPSEGAHLLKNLAIDWGTHDFLRNLRLRRENYNSLPKITIPQQKQQFPEESNDPVFA